MGQDISTPVDENVPAQVLDDRSLESVAKYILNGQAKKIVIMVRSSSCHRSIPYP